jgi:hypothetical protein
MNHATCDHANDYCTNTKDGSYGGEAVDAAHYAAAKAYAAKAAAALAALDG